MHANVRTRMTAAGVGNWIDLRQQPPSRQWKYSLIVKGGIGNIAATGKVEISTDGERDPGQVGGAETAYNFTIASTPASATGLVDACAPLLQSANWVRFTLLTLTDDGSGTPVAHFSGVGV